MDKTEEKSMASSAGIAMILLIVTVGAIMIAVSRIAK